MLTSNTKVLEFLEKTTGERPVVLHEQPDSGRTIIEKFEAIAAEAGFAVVLLTADDLGRAKDASTDNRRARQNVVLELGFFIGRLGRSRVVALYEEGVELPSDLSGLLYTSLAGNWHTSLAVELRSSGCRCRSRQVVEDIAALVLGRRPMTSSFASLLTGPPDSACRLSPPL